MERKNPYKGPSSYTIEDAPLFKGRDAEIAQFSNMVHQHDLSLIYSASGSGKTSFLQAGIEPILVSEGYVPVHIVFPDDVWHKEASEPCLYILRELCALPDVERHFKYADIASEDTFEDLRGNAWWLLHAYRWTRAGKEVFPLLVFDQFEEVFRKTTGRQDILHKLFSLLQDLSQTTVPERVQVRLDELEESQDLYVYPDSQTRYKVVFSFRKEYLGDFDYWTNARFSMRELLLSRMFLPTLARENAEHIIVEQGDNTLVDVKDLILDRLQHVDGSIEPILLSVTCTRFYDLAVNLGLERIDEETLNSRHISPDTVLGEFYEKNVQRVFADNRKHRRLFEQALIDADVHCRLRVQTSDKILRRMHFDERYKEKLLNARLIKLQRIEGDDYVELIHDRVAEYILSQSEQHNVRTRYIGGIVAMLLFIFLMGYGVFFSAFHANNNHTSFTFIPSKRYVAYATMEEVLREHLSPHTLVLSSNDKYDALNVQVYNALSEVRCIQVLGWDSFKVNLNRFFPMVEELQLGDSVHYWEPSISPALHRIILPNHPINIIGPLGLTSLECRKFKGEWICPPQSGYKFYEGVLWNADGIVYSTRPENQEIPFVDEFNHFDSLKGKCDDRIYYNLRHNPSIIQNDSLCRISKYYGEVLDLSGYDKIRKVSMLYSTVPLLKKLILPPNCTKLSLCDCPRLESIVFPPSMKEIASINDCPSLVSLDLPDSCEVTTNFAGDIRLKRIRIPSNTILKRKLTVPIDCEFELENGTLRYVYDAESRVLRDTVDSCIVSYTIAEKPLAEFRKYSLLSARLNGLPFIFDSDTSASIIYPFAPSERMIFPIEITDLHWPAPYPYPNMDRLCPDPSIVTLHVPYGSARAFIGNPQSAGFRAIVEDTYLKSIFYVFSEMVSGPWSYIKYIGNNGYANWIGGAIIALVVLLLVLLITLSIVKLSHKRQAREDYRPVRSFVLSNLIGLVVAPTVFVIFYWFCWYAFGWSELPSGIAGVLAAVFATVFFVFGGDIMFWRKLTRRQINAAVVDFVLSIHQNKSRILKTLIVLLFILGIAVSYHVWKNHRAKLIASISQIDDWDERVATIRVLS